MDNVPKAVEWACLAAAMLACAGVIVSVMAGRLTRKPHWSDSYFEKTGYTSTDQEMPELTNEQFMKLLDNLPPAPSLAGEPPGSTYYVGYELFQKVFLPWRTQSELAGYMMETAINVNPHMPPNIIVIEPPFGQKIDGHRLKIIIVEDE